MAKEIFESDIFNFLNPDEKTFGHSELWKYHVNIKKIDLKYVGLSSELNQIWINKLMVLNMTVDEFVQIIKPCLINVTNNESRSTNLYFESIDPHNPSKIKIYYLVNNTDIREVVGLYSKYHKNASINAQEYALAIWFFKNQSKLLLKHGIHINLLHCNSTRCNVYFNLSW